MQPFLKWPGGKRWLVNRYIGTMPEQFNCYFEPFVGGGAMFFELQPAQALLSDINAELINAYCVMRDHPDELAHILRIHNHNHNHRYYYEIRNQELTDSVELAARFVYLNRTCFNGMYRVNQAGRFNVPIGTKTDCIYDIDQFTAFSTALQNAEIITSDFSDTIQRADAGDVIFADPPYATIKGNSGFLKYNNRLFTWDDQVRLQVSLRNAVRRGVTVILTNVNCKEISDMYLASGFHVSRISRSSSISGKIAGRGKVEELLITSFLPNI